MPAVCTGMKFICIDKSKATKGTAVSWKIRTSGGMKRDADSNFHPIVANENIYLVSLGQRFIAAGSLIQEQVYHLYSQLHMTYMILRVW